MLSLEKSPLRSPMLRFKLKRQYSLIILLGILIYIYRVAIRQLLLDVRDEIQHAEGHYFHHYGPHSPVLNGNSVNSSKAFARELDVTGVKSDPGIKRAPLSQFQLSRYQTRINSENPNYQQPIFTSTKKHALAAKRQYKILYGFKYCTMLDGSQFDMLTRIRSWGSLAINHHDTELIELIDQHAEHLIKIYNDQNSLNVEDLKRTVCYFTAMGSNSVASLTDEKFLYQIDPHVYFADFSSLKPKSVPFQIEGPRKRFKWAYLVSVMYDFPKCTDLLEKIDDGETLVILSFYGDQRETADKWIKDNRKGKTSASGLPLGNIIIQSGVIRPADNQFIGRIQTILSGLWQIYDEADWDFLVVVDGWGEPPHFDRNEFLGHNDAKRTLIGYEDDNNAHFTDAADMGRVHVKTTWGAFADQVSMNIQFWPYPEFRLCTQKKFSMVLPRHFVEVLRTDRRTTLHLAYMEHTYTPITSFFCSVALSFETQVTHVINHGIAGTKEFWE